MKLTQTNVEPEKTTFGKLEDGQFFLLNKTLYKKVFTIKENGMSAHPPIFKKPFGVLIDTDFHGKTRSYGYRFDDSVVVQPVEVQEIQFKVV